MHRTFKDHEFICKNFYTHELACVWESANTINYWDLSVSMADIKIIRMEYKVNIIKMPKVVKGGIKIS